MKTLCSTLAVLACIVLCMPLTAQESNLSKFYIQNRGQVQDEKGAALGNTYFYKVGGGMQLFVTDKGYSLVHSSENKSGTEYSTIHINLEGANIRAENIVYTQNAQAQFNFYNANKTLEDVKAAQTVLIKSIYPGIDWMWSIDANGSAKHQFMVNIGADARQVKYSVQGAAPSAKGNVLTYTNKQFSVEEGPVVYQHTSGDLNAGMKLSGQQISFDIPSQLQGGGFTIDPSLSVVWGDSTFIGTQFTGIDVNATFETVTVGQSRDYLPVFPQVAGSYQSTVPKQMDVVIMKTDRLQNLIWATYFGGSDDDGANAVAIAPTGVFITGYSKSWNFPQNTLGNYTQPVQLFGQDAFVLKFDNQGKWKWGTGFGGRNLDEAYDIKYYDGRVTLAGYTFSPDLPLKVKAGAYNSTDSANANKSHGFIAEFDTMGNWQWSTYFGGPGNDVITAIDIDADGLFTTGTTDSTLIQQSFGAAYTDGLRQGGEGFITKFSPTGALQWSTYFGGPFNERPGGILHSPCGLFISGSIDSTGLPVLQQPGSHYQANFAGGGSDGFIAKFDANTLQQLHTSYMGGTNYDVLTRMDINNACELVVTGYSSSPIVNVGSPTYYFIQPTNNGGLDASIMQFTNNMALQWSTQFGTNKNDNGYDVKYVFGGAIDMVGRDLYNYGDFRIGGTYRTTPCSNYNNCPRVSSNGVSNRFMNRDSVSGGGLNGTGIGGGGGGCGEMLFFHAMIADKNTCPDACDGHAHIDTANIVGCPPYTFTWSSGGSELKDTSLCEFYWSMVTDASGQRRVLYNRFDILRVPETGTVQTQCGEPVNWLDYIHPEGGGPPYTVVFRGVKDNLCPTVAYFDIIDTAGCIVSHSLPWEEYNRDISASLYLNQNCTMAVDYGSLYPYQCVRADNDWQYVVTHGTDTFRAAVNNINSVNVGQVPNESVLYQAYIENAECSYPAEYFVQGALRDSVVATLACADSTGALKIIVFTDTATLSYYGNYDVNIQLIGDTVGAIPLQTLNVSSTNNIEFNFPNLIPDRYYIKIYTDNQYGYNGNYDTCRMTKHYFNLKTVDFNFNAGTDVYCGEADSLRINMTGGFAPFTYNWSHNPALNQPNILVTTPNTYTLKVTDSHGCTFTKAITVPGSPAIAIDTVLENLNPCSAGFFSTARVQYSGGTSPYSIVWSSGESSTIANYIPQGSAWVRITDVFGCTDQVNFVNTKKPGMEISESATNVSCHGANNGSISLGIQQGFPPYSIAWGHGPTTASLNNLQPNTYNYTITDSTNCQYSSSIEITEPPALSFNATPIAAMCTDDNGGAQITVSGGTTPIGIQWFDGSTLFARNDLAEGDHTFTITDANGCTISNMVHVNSVSLLNAQIFKTDVVCSNATNGSASVIPFNAAAPVVYTWSSGESVPTISNKPKGDYGITITDANGCRYEDTITIAGPEDFVPLIFMSQNEIYCNGDLIYFNVNAQGGTPPYTGDIGTFYYGAGNYTFTINDSKGCTTSQTISLTEPPAITLSSTTVDAFCGSPGEVTIYASGGVGPYYNTWNSFTNDITLTGLAPDDYYFDIYDANNCVAYINVTVGGYVEPGATLSTNDVSCNGADDGSIYVEITQGIAPFTVNNAPYLNPLNFDNLTPGTYAFNIADSAGCTTTLYTYIYEPSPIVVNVDTGIGIQCHGDMLSILVSASGGIMPYSGDIGNQNLYAGQQIISIQDYSGCSASVNFTLSEPEAISSTLQVIQPDCNNAMGSVFVSAQGGTGSYTVYIGSSYMVSFTDTITISGITPNQYPVTIEDDNMCSDLSSIYIQNFSQVQASYSSNNVSCYGMGDGQVSIDINGGTAPYFINGNVATPHEEIDTLRAGSYTYIITDNSGCPGDTLLVNIYEPDTLLASYSMVEDITCSSDAYTVVVTAFGGVYPYSGLDTLTYTTGGQYQHTVTDSKGCQATAEIDLATVNPLNVTFQTYNPNCPLGSGQLQVTATGGVGPYRLSDGNSSLQFANTITVNLQPNGYTYKIIDAKGCEELISFVIGGATAQASISFNPTACFGQSTGNATIHIAGSSSQFTVNGIDFTDSLVINGLASGYHQFNVVDGAGCSIVLDGQVPEPNVLRINNNLVASNITCYNRTDGAIYINATGGTPAYTYNLVRAPGDTLRQTQPSFGNIAAGSYSVLVIDSNGCSDAAPFTILPYTPGEDSISIDTIQCYGYATGAIRLYPTPADRNPYTFSLNGGAPQVHNVFYDLTAGDYVVEVADKNGCADTLYINIPQPDSIDGRVWLNGDLLPQDSTLIRLREEAVFTKLNNLEWEVIFTPDERPTETSDTLIRAKPREPVAYVVYVYQDSVDRSCYKRYDGFIDIEQVPVLPDIITPNGDGFNDIWAIDLDKYPNSRVLIFDRWGATVYESDSYNNDWAGVYQKSGERVADGTYFYLLTPSGQNSTVLKGAINVLNSSK